MLGHKFEDVTDKEPITLCPTVYFTWELYAVLRLKY